MFLDDSRPSCFLGRGLAGHRVFPRRTARLIRRFYTRRRTTGGTRSVVAGRGRAQKTVDSSLRRHRRRGHLAFVAFVELSSNLLRYTRTRRLAHAQQWRRAVDNITRAELLLRGARSTPREAARPLMSLWLKPCIGCGITAEVSDLN